MLQTSVHNLIILDKSGSMNSIRNEAIAGVNETIGSIQAAERKNPDQKQFISLLLFCGCEQRYLLENIPASDAKFIADDDYIPCCSTPLNDAIGNACTHLEKMIKGETLTSVSVTIITDGYENSSKEFTREAVSGLIERLKKQGWMFAYIGADHDVKSVAFSLNISNVLQFEKSVEGTKAMFCKANKSRESYFSRVYNALSKCASIDEMTEERVAEVNAEMAENFFEDK